MPIYGRLLKSHVGLLVWIYNDQENVGCNIRKEIKNIRIEQNYKYPVTLVDNARAGFILNVIDDAKRKLKNDHGEFFFPPIGTSVHVDEPRTGNKLPLELIASDIIFWVFHRATGKELVIYADQNFDFEAYKKLISYSLQFSNGLIDNIKIGMPDYNHSLHEADAKIARLSFSERMEHIEPFSFNRSIYSLLEEQ